MCRGAAPLAAVGPRREEQADSRPECLVCNCQSVNPRYSPAAHLCKVSALGTVGMEYPTVLHSQELTKHECGDAIFPRRKSSPRESSSNSLVHPLTNIMSLFQTSSRDTAGNSTYMLVILTSIQLKLSFQFLLSMYWTIRSLFNPVPDNCNFKDHFNLRNLFFFSTFCKGFSRVRRVNFDRIKGWILSIRQPLKHWTKSQAAHIPQWSQEASFTSKQYWIKSNTTSAMQNMTVSLSSCKNWLDNWVIRHFSFPATTISHWVERVRSLFLPYQSLEFWVHIDP